MAEHSLAGKVAVVTGGARGMGQEMVRGLLAAGCKVAAIDRSWQSTGLSHDTAEAFREELDPANAVAPTADMTDEPAIDQAFTRAMDTFGTVDILINNAGMRMREVDPSTYSPILETSMELWQRMLDVNVLGPVRMIRRVAPLMIEKRSGSIINISSNSGAVGRAGDNPYGASKAALTNLSESLSKELAEYGVAVNVIFPAGTQSTGYDEQSRLRRERLGTPPGRVLRPEAIVPLVLWLVAQSPETTGRVFSVTEWLQEHGHGPLERWMPSPP
jgi:NAD(P)-dependent dehydrogenase (short-subunit alcohol dehydrogenase family)